MNNYQKHLAENKEYAQVINITPPLVTVEGFPSAKLNEQVFFENGLIGRILTISRDSAMVLMLNNKPVAEGEKASRSDHPLSIPVGEELLGCVINPLGESVFEKKKIITKEKRFVDNKPLGISSRTRITRPFLTGTALVDLLVPLGRGQRELVIGDINIGKTAFVLTAAEKQAREGSVIIYACIGKRASDIISIVQFFSEKKILKNSIIVASLPSEPTGLIHLTPFTAATLAEYFRDQGKDVFVIFDSLSTHAKYHREISLAAKQFPGRESYPSDIFYLHSRLLERAGCFSHPTKKQVSITCLPIMETIESDMTSYISTNLMGMTDGHIFFDSQLFVSGRRPAINVYLSVTRVGKQTCSGLKRELYEELMKRLSVYETMKSYVHFGTELAPEIRQKIKQGEMIYNLMQQGYRELIDEEIPLIISGLIIMGYFNQNDRDIAAVKKKLIEMYEKQTIKTKLKEVIQSTNIDDFIKKLEQNLEIFKI